MDDKVLIVQIDAIANVNIPIPIVKDGETVEIFPTENPVVAPVYELPRRDARNLLAARPNRYKLYQTAPMQIFVKQPDQSTTPKWFFPWHFRKVARQKLDVNGQPMFDSVNGEVLWDNDVIEWFEDLEGKSVVRSADGNTQPDYAALLAQIAELAKKVGDLKNENVEQEKKIGNLSKAVVQRDAELEKFRSGKKGVKVATSPSIED